MAGADTSTEDDDLEEVKAAKARADDAWSDTSKSALDAFRFARLGEQWPERIRRDRELEGRPCLTINRLPAFIRQVVNDARQNKPAITTHPVDSGADPDTAKIYNGLIRHIEQSSDADVAYDTAIDHSATGGFGFFKINTRYATDDGFEQDLVIEAVPNPFAITPDPDSTAADSADWNVAFESWSLRKAAFERRWDGAEAVSFGSDLRDRAKGQDSEDVQLVNYWVREETVRRILALKPTRPLSDDEQAQLGNTLPETMILDEAVYKQQKGLFDALGYQVVGQPRDVLSHKVEQRICSGADVLERLPWAGKWIPIIPVYGEDLNIEGVRHLSGLVRGAMDPQRMFNYWRPLALDTLIPTPSGWSTMGDLREGDQVFDETGAPCSVVGKSPVHIGRRCYRVTFDDGSSIVADAEHPWPVEERAGRAAAGFRWSQRLARTDELEPGKHFIATAGALKAPAAELPVDPYVLGIWLGDGLTMGGRVTPGDEDLDEVRSRIEARGYRCGVVSGQPERHGTFVVHGLQAQLSAAGLLGYKHIPAAYLRASEDQRRELLRGLMDTDGSINRATLSCEFTTTSDALARGFEELLRGLGIKAKSVERRGRGSKLVNGGNHLMPVTQFYFTAYADEEVFGLARKAVLLGERPEQRRRTKRHAIAKIERVATVPVQCIAIDAPSHLFLAGAAMVPTHNTTSTELVALAPKAPFIGRAGSFDTDQAKWATANVQSHAFIEYDVPESKPDIGPPQRQPFAGVPAGALQEALNAADDMKSILGIYDASLGARSNETSGRAIMARQRESDVGSFHYIDNLSRAIRHAGRILLDMIPKVYGTERVIRVLGPEGEVETVHVAPKEQAEDVRQKLMMAQQQGPQAQPVEGQEQAEDIARVYSLDVGKYDLTVTAGPSFTSRREEAANQMIEFIRAFPQAAPIIGDLLAKNLEWPGAEELAERFKALLPAQLQGENAETQAAKAQIQKMAEIMGQLKAENQSLKADKSIEGRKVDVDAFEAETGRIKAFLGKDGGPYDPTQMAMLAAQSTAHALASPDILEAIGAGVPQEQIAQMIAQRMQPPAQEQQPAQAA